MFEHNNKNVIFIADAKFAAVFFSSLLKMIQEKEGLALYICNSSGRFYTGLVMDKNAIIHRS